MNNAERKLREIAYNTDQDSDSVIHEEGQELYKIFKYSTNVFSITIDEDDAKELVEKYTNRTICNIDNKMTAVKKCFEHFCNERDENKKRNPVDEFNERFGHLRLRDDIKLTFLTQNVINLIDKARLEARIAEEETVGIVARNPFNITVKKDNNTWESEDEFFDWELTKDDLISIFKEEVDDDIDFIVIDSYTSNEERSKGNTFNIYTMDSGGRFSDEVINMHCFNKKEFADLIKTLINED